MDEREIFVKKFELPRDGFSEPIHLTDVEIGFCTYKDQDALERENFKSIFKLYIRNEELRRNGDIKSITITANYGKEEDSGLVLFSNDFERGTNWPAELISVDEYFYNIRTHDLLRNGKSISGKELLDQVNNLHLKPTRPIDGFPFRIRLACHNILLNLLKILFYFVSGIQYLISGERVSFYSECAADPIVKPGKKIKVFDFEVEFWIAFIYAIIHLGSYILFFVYNYRPRIITTIFKNNFLVIMYIIISLGSMDAVLSKLPRVYLTKGVLTFIQKGYYKIASKGIKV